MDKIIKIIFALTLIATVELSAASLPSTPAGSSSSDENTGWYSNTSETAPMLEVQHDLTFGELVDNPTYPQFWTHPTIDFVLGDTLNFTDLSESFELIGSDEPGFLWLLALGTDKTGIGAVDYFEEATVPISNEIWAFSLFGSLYGGYLIRKRRKKNKA